MDFNEELSIPSENVKKDEATNLIELAESRLQIERASKFSALSDEELTTISWFMKTTDDPDMRRQIFGRLSMKMLAELGSIQAWMQWLKDTFEKNEEENREFAERELKRPKPNENELMKDKWKLQIRLFSASHSIRQKPLNQWNDISKWIKLTSVGGAQHKNELLVEFTLPMAVSADQLWWHGWGLSRKLVTALNIGSSGFFWWNLPKLTNRYYEKLMDVENNLEMKIARSPSLTIDWGNRALGEAELRNVALCFSSIPSAEEIDQMEPFDFYVGGLTFLGINDINWQCEQNAFGNFWHSLLSAAKIFGGCKENILIHMKEHFADLSLEESFLEEYCDLGKRLEGKTIKPNEITLKEVGTMKVLCDMYLLSYFRSQHRATTEQSRHDS